MKIFAVSDIHGFTSILRESLTKAGFEINNPEHLLVVCGDLFDRGKEARQLIRYLRNIHNKILIRGNHEDLMYEMIDRGYPIQHDISNGTYNTAQQLGWDDLIQEVDFRKVKSTFDVITKDMVDYFETKNYIFVHGWIPVTVKDNLPNYYTRNRDFEFNPEWRTSNNWEMSRWLNGIDMNSRGFNEPNKTIVCGHWHCSYGYHLWEGAEEFGEYAKWEPFRKEGIIAIDRCTAYTNEMNVLVLEDDLLDGSK